MRKCLRIAIGAGIGSLLLLSGCATAPSRHDAPPKPWYAPGPLPAIDASGLVGRTLVLDPGHGGSFSGAMGKSLGLAEKDLNLKVALNLKAMLETAGARVFMTRDTDRDFLTAPGNHVREDLERRIAGVDSLRPDLFVSIHHNACDDTLNMTKTFYKLDDDGASLDAAMRMHQAFVLGLRLDSSELSAGNYYVIRNVRTPAVLGEPSYLSNPSMEAILQRPEALRLEAESYYRGLAAWFKDGVPAITGFTFDSVGNTLNFTVESATPLDMLSARVGIDGREIPCRVIGNTLVAPLSEPLTNDCHRVRTRVKNINGNSSASQDFEFTLDRQAALINAYCHSIMGRAGQIVPIHVTVTDAFGLPMSDATLVNTNIGQMGLVRNGQAVIYAVFGKHTRITFQCGPVSCDLTLKAGNGFSGYYQGFVKNETGASLPSLVQNARCASVATDANGFFQLPETCDSVVTVCARGFDDLTATLVKGQINTIALERAEGGRLTGKRIIIDPEFGGMESGGMSKTGIRASDINRKLAQALFDKFRRGGVDVVLARNGDDSRFVSERVGLANRPLADMYILIKTDTMRSQTYIASYPNSQFGGIAKQSVSQEFNSKGIQMMSMEVYNYVLQQSPCTAIEVSAIPFNSADPLEPGRINTASECIFNGISKYFDTLATQSNSKK